MFPIFELEEYVDSYPFFDQIYLLSSKIFNRLTVSVV